jgi:hypothetical protein
MFNLKNLSLEYKITALFAIVALIVSLLTGLIMGIRWYTVLLRSAVIAVVFTGMGYGACAVVKRYVPEIYDLLASLVSRAIPDAGDSTAAGTSPHEAEDKGGADAAGEDRNRPDMKQEPEFKELDNDTMDHYTTSPGGSGGVNTARGKLGKHVLQTEKLAKYEPKVIAKAIRTMMKKDD